MAALVISPWNPADTDMEHTPLARSLRAQTSSAWSLTTEPGRHTGTDDVAMRLPLDTTLPDDACATILGALAERPGATALYGDLTTGGRRRARPAWSPTRVQSEPGSSLPLAVRCSTPGLASDADPFDIERRLAESRATVLHVPHVLSNHPARLPPPAAEEPDDPRFEPGHRPGTRRRRPSPEGQSQVTIVIPSAGIKRPGAPRSLLDRCLDTLDKLDPPPAEIIVVLGDEFRGDPPLSVRAAPMRVLHRGRGPFDFSRAVNCGLLASRSESVLMLNDDIEAETSDWLGRMAAHLEDPTVGAVGSALLYPNRTLQHVGTLIDDARPMHSFVGQSLEEAARHGGDVARDVIAVTGACLLTRRRDLLAVGGLSPELPVSYGDIDLCLRMRRFGLRVVVEPAAILLHHESGSREPVIEPWEWNRFVHRWGEVADPWYHPAYWRPDEPGWANRNADHLEPIDPDGAWPARDTLLRSRVHRSRVHWDRERSEEHPHSEQAASPRSDG